MLLSQSYGNQDSVSFTYDHLGRAKTTTYKDENGNAERVLSYIYTGDGQLYSVHDSATGYTYIYTYDPLGRLTASRVEDSSGETLMRTQLGYNASNQITKQTWTVGDTTYQETYAYNTGDATLSSYQNALGQTVSLGYDFLRRLSTVTAGNIYTQTYTYRDIDESKTTTQVSGLAYSGFAGAPSYGYTYDTLGNILTYTENGTAYAYTYDDLNQLLTATGGGKAWAYTYDLGGNILTATDGTTSHTYTYGDANWADLLTAYDGQTITYDGSGNPLSYYNGSRYTFTWAEGRRLTSAAVNGKTYTYSYDSDGLRLSKTVDGVTHNYFYASGNLLRETWGTNILDFFYDNTGSPYALNYNGTTYYYITNLQGDVLGLIDASGNSVASYTYDPYGKVLTATGTMAEINPLRYRGYYYDSETELYYLQSRYYDPTTCRFINADAYASTGQSVTGYNMFAYCGNNPIKRRDTDGYWFEDIVIAALELLWIWIDGDGSDMHFDKDDTITKRIRNNDFIQSEVDRAFSNYEKGLGDSIGPNTKDFSAGRDGLDLYLSTHNYSYEIKVTTERRTIYHPVFSFLPLWEEERYVATVRVWDKYDFSLNEWKGFGNILNNMAYIIHQFEVGEDYFWDATYTETTNWRKIPSSSV